MRWQDIISETIKFETFLASHYKALAGQVENRMVKPILDLLGEESILHATKLGYVSSMNIETSGATAPLEAQVAVIKRELGALSAKTDLPKLVSMGIILEKRLGRLYEYLSESTAAYEGEEVSSMFQSLATDEDFHWALLESARVLLAQDLTFDNTT